VRHDISEIKMMANDAAFQDEARIGKSEVRISKSETIRAIQNFEKGKKRFGFDILRFSVFPQLVSDFGFGKPGLIFGFVTAIFGFSGRQET